MRTPLSTYRLQLGPHLTFDDVTELLPYLQQLGVSDGYTSPFFETSSTGSHGYDVSDHNRLRDELGGEPAFRRLAAALRERGLGLLIDLVPNHMGIAQNRNARWLDVLEKGPTAPSAAYFDIDWAPAKAELAGKVLLPILGDAYGTVLDSGQLKLVLDEHGFSVRYYDTVLPLAPRSFARILGHRLEELNQRLGADHPELRGLKSLIAWFTTIPSDADTSRERLGGRQAQIERGRRRLLELLDAAPPVREFVEDNVRRFNGAPGNPQSFDLLDGLLGEQAYRLAYWRVAGEEINYRRFFDINELAAIRMEDREVFDETHRLIHRLVGDGTVTGLRIDHPDGLYAPAQYFERLQQACGAESRPLVVVAEKILAAGEQRPPGWAVAGTTGHEFLNLVNGVFVDRSQARAVDDAYTRLLRDR